VLGYLGTFLRDIAQKTASRKTLSGSAMVTCAKSIRMDEKVQMAAWVESSDRPRMRAPAKQQRPMTADRPTIDTKNLYNPANFAITTTTTTTTDILLIIIFQRSNDLIL